MGPNGAAVVDVMGSGFIDKGGLGGGGEIWGLMGLGLQMLWGQDL